jgi:Arc/MetJ-type ribon-helix-helix transcriptional regulator
MLNELPPDVLAEIKQRMASGNYTSEEDVLRQAMRALKVHDEELAAIQMGIDDVEAGRVRAFEDVDTELCQNFGFSRER